MSERLVVQIAGPARSGKSEISRHLAENYDFSVVLISDIIRAYADMQGLILSHRASYLETFKDMKQDLGNDVVADVVLEASGTRICTDGNRVPADVKRLRCYPGVVIALDCPPEIRFERAQELHSPLDKLNFEDFVQDDLAESTGSNPELQMLDSVVAEADYNIDSSRSLQDVLQDVDKIVVPLLG